MAGRVPGNALTDKILQLNSRYKAWKTHRRDRRLVPQADSVLVSFPKSGRTWVRVMLSRLCHTAFDLPEDTLLWFANDFGRAKALDPRIPSILFTHDVNAMVHKDQITADKSHYAGRPLALLSRHPADVVVSRYHHLKHRSTDPGRRHLARAPIEDFVWTDYGGLPAIITWMNYWADAVRQNPEFRIFRYDDLRGDTAPHLLALALHLGVPATEEAAREAADFAAFEKLKAKEAAGFFREGEMRPRREGAAESFKVRSGKVGGWRDSFSPEDLVKIEAMIAERLDPDFGYGAPSP